MTRFTGWPMIRGALQAGAGDSLRTHVVRVTPEPRLRRLTLGLLLLASTALAGEWLPHEVRQINGAAGDVRLPADRKSVV